MKKVQGNIIQIRPEGDITEKKTAGGIIIPKSAKVKGKALKGEVVGIGRAPGFDFEVKVGDKVLFLPSRREIDKDGFSYVSQSEIVYIYDRT
jgi:co-chaperonin GroES (HSP10)